MDISDLFADGGDSLVESAGFVSYVVERHKRPPITVSVVKSHPLWGGGWIWNAARFLARFLDGEEGTETFTCSEKSFLELGAGSALPSLIAALNGASQVVISDYPDEELVSNIQRNVDTVLDEAERINTHIVGYLWGENSEPLLTSLNGRKFDVILLSDVIYHHMFHRKLLSTIVSCLNEEKGRALVSYTHHRPWLVDKDMDFFRLAESEFGLQTRTICKVKMNPMFPDDPGDIEVRSTVHLVELTIGGSIGS